VTGGVINGERAYSMLSIIVVVDDQKGLGLHLAPEKFRSYDNDHSFVGLMAHEIYFLF